MAWLICWFVGHRHEEYVRRSFSGMVVEKFERCARCDRKRKPCR